MRFFSSWQAFEWNRVGTRFDLSWLHQCSSDGGLPPPKEEDLKNKSFLEVIDVGVKRMHTQGYGIPNSFFYWHWTMMVLYVALFGITFVATTDSTTPAAFPWLTLFHKLLIFFNLWECLGLGGSHGPLHSKMSPPFQDWWYRMTPGTMKYNAPFWKWFGVELSMKRNYVDVAVEGFLTYGIAIYALLQPEVTPTCMIPVMLCSLYEFFFDFGQHIHNYGTQNLHLFMCCCFSIEKGQLAGIQLFLNFFYFCSGICKIGPTFQYMFATNLLTSRIMVNSPRCSQWFKNRVYNGVDKGDYTLKQPAAYWLATSAALVETIVPLLTWFNDWPPVALSIFTFLAMHAFIVCTWKNDIFIWNLTDAIGYLILYGCLGPGVDWSGARNMDPRLALWLVCHVCYVVYGHIYVDDVPYVVAHRHAAGNWAQGVLVVKKTAIAKLTAGIKVHAGFPTQGPGWLGEWWYFQAFWAYAWNFNLNTKVLPALVLKVMATGKAPVGPTYASGDYVFIHSVKFFDTLIGHLRFDGLSNIDLVAELGRVCGFEENDCVLCWTGAFPSFLLPPKPRASWKIFDAATGFVEGGTYCAEDVCDPAYKRPSDLFKTKLPGIVGLVTGEKKCT